jgi:hypothetical protein
VRYEARRALQSIRFRCLAADVSAERHPLGVSYSFRVLPVEVPPVSVRRSRYAVSHFLGFAVFPRRARGKQLSSRTDLSSSFALRQSITQRTLVSRPEPVDSSRRLRLPSAHEGSEIHLPQAYHTCYVPPSGFDYPLDGLRPPSPCRFCFTPAALMGFALRSFPLPQGIHTSPRG